MNRNAFKYTFEVEDRTRTSYNIDGKIEFYPPVYEQRYQQTINVLEDKCWSGLFKKVVDFGASEMKLFPLLRRVSSIEHIIEVDIDEPTLKVFHQRVNPLVVDYLKKRDNPLRVEIYKGSIDVAADQLKGVDVVIALEVIEHLEESVLKNIPANIFGFIQPKLVIVTTPNADYNVIFDMLPNGFRHLDHKFEWTRKQFHAWSYDICRKYNNYKVSFHGIGKPPHDKSSIGFVSQMAIFARNDIINQPLVKPLQDHPPVNVVPETEYKLLHSVDYPVFVDSRTKEEKIIDEIRYEIDRCKHLSQYYDEEHMVYKVPFHIIHKESLECTEEQLKEILEKQNYKIEDRNVICNESSDEDEGSSNGDYNDLDTLNMDIEHSEDENWD